MNGTEDIRKKIDRAQPITWGDLARCFSLDRRTIKKWIEDNIEGIEFPDGEKKYFFTPAEAKKIVNEWEEK